MRRRMMEIQTQLEVDEKMILFAYQDFKGCLLRMKRDMKRTKNKMHSEVNSLAGKVRVLEDEKNEEGESCRIGEEDGQVE